MSFRKNRSLLLIAIALAAALWGIYRTGSQQAPPTPRGGRRAPTDRSIVVDQSSLVTAEALVHLPVTAEERPFAEDALRLADNEMDLAFAQAVRRAAGQPRATSDTAREAEARLQQSLRALAADQAQVAALTKALASAATTAKESLTDRLNLASAQEALDQDEVDDARGDLRRAGGDPHGRMEEMIAQHEAASKSSDSVHVVVTNPVEGRGLVRHVRALLALYQKAARLEQAGAQADSLALIFKQRHDRVEARSAAMARDSASSRMSHDSAKVLLATAQRRALDGKIRATLDARVDNQRRLSTVYAGWLGALGAQDRSAVNRILRDLAVILGIVLVTMLSARWIEHALGEKAERGQTFHLVARGSMQVLATLLIAFVLFGPPDNLGTILGLAGAGLTVALKDFILGFMGWFVLIGKNGMRVGDLVEIDGVTGEVIELGMFRTVLLETGDWTEPGNPTGRRVTINNSFAIEGHYFNFSTAGRWSWDHVRIVVPAGRDPYPIAVAVQKQAEEATVESAREAQAQWSDARRSAHDATPPTGATMSLRPIVGGVEIIVRYITRASEREELRTKLGHTAVAMLGAS